MTDKLHISASAYGKVEREITGLTLDRLALIAEIFGMDIIELINYDSPTIMNENIDPEAEAAKLMPKIQELEAILQEKNREMEVHRQSVVSILYDAYHDAFMQFEVPMPFEELDETSWGYLEICGICTKEEYEEADMPVGWVEPDKDAEVFGKMIDNSSIYMLFERGLVPDEWNFLKLWQEFKSKGKPIFKVEGNRITRIDYPGS